tara:strand:- start:242 stop:535 length:294 start_codon:yes stop_codon:yes gene_type:complete
MQKKTKKESTLKIWNVTPDQLSPFEKAEHWANTFLANMITLNLVQELVETSEEARAGYLDRSLPKDVRIEALKSGKEANDQLKVIATINEIVYGISA